MDGVRRYGMFAGGHARRARFDSQADSAGSIPVTRSTTKAQVNGTLFDPGPSCARPVPAMGLPQDGRDSTRRRRRRARARLLAGTRTTRAVAPSPSTLSTSTALKWGNTTSTTPRSRQRAHEERQRPRPPRNIPGAASSARSAGRRGSDRSFPCDRLGRFPCEPATRAIEFQMHNESPWPLVRSDHCPLLSRGIGRYATKRVK